MIKELSAGIIIFRRIICDNSTTTTSIEYLLLQKETQNNKNHLNSNNSNSNTNNNNDFNKQHWTFPKGHVDNGETDLEAAIRETKEEAGLDVNDFRLFFDFKLESSYVSRKGISKTVWYWIAEINNPNVEVNLSDSHKQYKWLRIEDALELVKYESMKSGLVKANQFLLNRISSSS